MNINTEKLKNWIYDIDDIYFFMLGRTDNVVDEIIKNNRKKNISELIEHEINGVIYVMSDCIKQSVNTLINKVEKRNNDTQICLFDNEIALLKINLKEIQYKKLALYYFNLLVKRHNCLKEF